MTFKAYLAIALDARMQMDEPLEKAAREVCNAYHRAAQSGARSSALERTRIKNWREEFQRTDGPAGLTRDIYERSLRELEALAARAGDEDYQHLKAVAEKAVKRAVQCHPWGIR